MEVTFYATLQQVVGEKKVCFELEEGATVQNLLDEMLRRYPALRRELLDEHGRLYRHVHIFIRGREALFLEEGLDTALSPDETVGVFPAIGGGWG